MRGLEIQLAVPDLWQQEAVFALKSGRDVVVHAPTGAGKTFIFELFAPRLKGGQAIFTVPTRALANDKLAEWRKKGWQVGIATGDLALNVDAPVLVATLETQKGEFLRRRGPRLLAVDEYQMIGDPVRGINYELALALAPRETQLLLLSGSVGNPAELVEWLRRIGRDAVLVAHGERPVPLEEIDLLNLSGGERVREFWPRAVCRAVHAGLDPVLLFAPKRNAAEALAHAIAAALPNPDPLPLTPEQELLAGPRLSKLLKARVAYHHSGLGYAVRAGLIEPLAKAGQLRAVVATMGLASGINFSMRSVLVTDTRYFAGAFERSVQPDELLQMFGRAGRRGLDEAGFVLTVPGKPRLADARPRQLRRAVQVDWPSLVAVMGRAGQSPRFAAAAELTHGRLFSRQRVPLGVERSLGAGPAPCGLWVDAERARRVRKGIVEMLNSKGEWEPRPPEASVRLCDLWVRERERWIPALRRAEALRGLGHGNLCRLRGGTYGREIPAAFTTREGAFLPVKWVRRKLREGLSLRGKAPAFSRPLLEERFPAWVAPGRVREWVTRGSMLVARVDYAEAPALGPIDSHGRALASPPLREELPLSCRGCPELETCRAANPAGTPALAWRQLGLVEADGTPTVRGTIFGFFNAGEGLAVAAALEEADYPVADLLFDLANLRAGPRFAGDEPVLGGRLGTLCQRVYQRADHPGYLEMGVPSGYGAGASEVVREVVEAPGNRHRLVNETLRHGDIERALCEWLSLLRHIARAPGLELPRWRELQEAASKRLAATAPPTRPEFPPLLATQARRYERAQRR